MTGDELRARIDRLGLHYTKAAALLGLSLSGLHHQLRGLRGVTRRTELLLEKLETERDAQPLPRPRAGRRNRRA
jgi:hypothetical protein